MENVDELEKTTKVAGVATILRVYVLRGSTRTKPKNLFREHEGFMKVIVLRYLVSSLSFYIHQEKKRCLLTSGSSPEHLVAAGSAGKYLTFS
jgi:hypothetical protein